MTEEFNLNNNEDEEKYIEVMEFSLNEEDINELIVKLVELKHTRQPFTYEVDENNELSITFDENGDENLEK